MNVLQNDLLSSSEDVLLEQSTHILTLGNFRPVCTRLTLPEILYSLLDGMG